VLRQRKARRDTLRKTIPMMKTYQVYLTGAEGQSWFEPILAENPTQLIARLRERLARHRLRQARVEQNGHVIFTLER